MPSTAEQVKQVISDEMGIDVEEIQDDKNLCHDLGCDSLDIVELLIDLEDKFSIEIDDLDFEKLYTVKSVIGFIEKKIGKAA